MYMRLMALGTERRRAAGNSGYRSWSWTPGPESSVQGRPRVEVQGPRRTWWILSIVKKNVGAPVALLVLLRAGSSEVLGLAAQVR